MEISKHVTEWLFTMGANMLMQLGISCGQSIVDFGCGEGRYTIPLSQIVGENGNVYAVERDLNTIAKVQERMRLYTKFDNIHFVQFEMLEEIVSLQKNSIDAILVFDVLQYVENRDLLFRVFRNLLKNNGYVYVYPAAIPHPGDVDMAIIIKQMSEVGFTYVQSKTYTMMHSVDIVNDDIYTFCLL